MWSQGGFSFLAFSFLTGSSEDKIIAATIPPSGRYDCSTWGPEDAETGVLSDLLQVCCLAFRIILNTYMITIRPATGLVSQLK